MDCLAAMVMWPYVDMFGQCNDLEIVQVFFPLESSIKFNYICSKVCDFHFWPCMPDQPKPKENVNCVCAGGSGSGATHSWELSPVAVEWELPYPDGDAVPKPEDTGPQGIDIVVAVDVAQFSLHRNDDEEKRRRSKESALNL